MLLGEVMRPVGTNTRERVRASLPAAHRNGRLAWTERNGHPTEPVTCLVGTAWPMDSQP